VTERTSDDRGDQKYNEVPNTLIDDEGHDPERAEHNEEDPADDDLGPI
jgi:hypothetical protein